MVKLISLHGKFSGSAAVESSGDGKDLKITVKLRGNGNRRNIPDNMTVYLVDGSAAARTILKNGTGTGKAADFRGLLLSDENGDFISEGLCGMNNAELEKAKAAVRMMQFSNPVRETAEAGESRASEISAGNGRIKEKRSGNESAFPHQKKYPHENSDPNDPNKEGKTVFPAESNRTGRGNARAQNPYSQNQHNQNRYSQNRQSGRQINSGNGKRAQSAKPSGASAADSGNSRYGKHPEKHSGASGFSGRNGCNNRPQRNMAQVTSEILDTARRLFEMQNNMDRPPFQSSADTSERNAKTAEDAVQPYENPFPQLFPDSEWKTLSGDASKLSGRAKVKGVFYNITAVRSSNRRYPPKGLGGNIRRLYSKD